MSIPSDTEIGPETREYSQAWVDQMWPASIRVEKSGRGSQSRHATRNSVRVGIEAGRKYPEGMEPSLETRYESLHSCIGIEGKVYWVDYSLQAHFQSDYVVLSVSKNTFIFHPSVLSSAFWLFPG